MVLKPIKPARNRLICGRYPPQECSPALQPMTDSKSLRQIESLLETLPGISDASLVRSESSGAVVGVVHCAALSAFDALARCAFGANVAVTLGQSESLQFRKLGPVTGLNCRIEFSDNENERPTLCERFGFYAAMLLYNDSLVGDNLLSYRPPAPETWLPPAAGLSTPTDVPTRSATQ